MISLGALYFYKECKTNTKLFEENWTPKIGMLRSLMSHFILQVKAFGSKNRATKMDFIVPYSNMIAINDSSARYFLRTWSCNQNCIKTCKYVIFPACMKNDGSIHLRYWRAWEEIRPKRKTMKKDKKDNSQTTLMPLLCMC